jgi:hypothetical protein
MHRPTLAGPRRRTRRALLAAALPAALAAAALPAAAHAATVAVDDGILRYQAGSGEVNGLSVRVADGSLVFGDQAQIAAGSGCRIDEEGNAVCRSDVDLVQVALGDRNDTVLYRAPHFAVVGGEAGDDTFFGGVREPSASAREQLNYVGGPGSDLITYVFADRGVRVDTASSAQEDGRPGDLEFVHEVERIEGSNLDDVLFGSSANDLLRGLNGNDVIAGRGGNDTIDEGSAPSGADTISGADGIDRISYGTRTSGVSVSLDGVRNDGATGENDNLGASVDNVTGTNFRDVLTGNDETNAIDAFGGNDTIDGRGGNDTLSAGTGNNGVTGGAGNDVVFARNNAIDNIDCGTETDTLDRDAEENRVVGCEKVTVGVLGLAPKALAAETGKTARLRLSWRHPQGWRKLRKLELRLSHDGTSVGGVTIRPRGERLAADGAVKLVRKRTRLTRTGRTVTARLALRLDESLAGQVLKAEVDATDRSGARQLERDAGTVRVAR